MIRVSGLLAEYEVQCERPNHGTGHLGGKAVLVEKTSGQRTWGYGDSRLTALCDGILRIADMMHNSRNKEETRVLPSETLEFIAEQNAAAYVSDEQGQYAGFNHQDCYITNPFLDPTGRFPVNPLDFYGEKNWSMWVNQIESIRSILIAQTNHSSAGMS